MRRSSRPKKGAESARQSGEKARSWWRWRMARAYLWGSASSRPRPHECTLIEATLDDVSVPRRDRSRSPQKVTRLIYDRAADSDPLRKRLAERGVKLICPHRVNRRKPKLQDGRKLRRYRCRWKIERTFAWLQDYRGLAIRYKRKPQLFQAFVHLACLLVTLKRL